MLFYVAVRSREIYCCCTVMTPKRKRALRIPQICIQCSGISKGGSLLIPHFCEIDM